jgi:hypothetical protein
MPLVHCRTCGKEISELAQTCPQCGAPQMVKKKSNNTIVLILFVVIVAVGAIYFIKNGLPGSNKIIIPEGAYILEKSPDKGLLKVLEAVSSNLKGLGDHLTVYGDSIVQSTGTISSLLSNIDGTPTKFKLKKTGTDKQFLLYLDNGAIPLELTESNELKIEVGGTTLLYQHQ